MKKIITLVLLSGFAINVQAVPIASIDVQFIRFEDNFPDLRDTYVYEVDVSAAVTESDESLSVMISGSKGDLGIGGTMTSLTDRSFLTENPAGSGMWDITFNPAYPPTPVNDVLELRIIEGTTFQLQLTAVSTRGLVVSQTTVFSETFLDGRVVNDVPIPATTWLVGSALVGLIGLGKRKKARV